MLQKRSARDLRNPTAPVNRARVGTEMDQDFPYEIGSLDGLARAPPPSNGAQVIRH